MFSVTTINNKEFTVCPHQVVMAYECGDDVMAVDFVDGSTLHLPRAEWNQLRERVEQHELTLRKAGK